MISPEMHVNESERQAALDSYNILDTPADDRFDNITQLMAQISGAPVCLISLLDHERNWFKSHWGIDLQESPRAISFCGHTINENSPIMVVEDARLDNRFHDNPLVTEMGAVFYAGVALESAEGFRIGTLCLYDYSPRSLDDITQRALVNFANQVVLLLELRRNNRLLSQTSHLLQVRNHELAEFAQSVVHDLKTPISNIVLMSDLVEAESQSSISVESKAWLGKVKSAAQTMATYVEDLLELYTSDKMTSQHAERVEVAGLADELKNLATGAEQTTLTVGCDSATIEVNRSVLLQILVNLVSNSIKYCDKNKVVIHVDIVCQQDSYKIEVEDNGQGIREEQLDSLFALYSKGDMTDRHGDQGTGIGLNRVKQLVSRAGGEVSIRSTVGEGTVVTFTLAKKRNSLRINDVT